MKILMMTNTYLPHVGGVARSVASFTEEFRRRGHEVLVVAPTYDELPEDDTGVLRVPAITKFNGSDFSLRLPVPLVLSSAFDDFQPDVVHAHHPFLLGDTALRVAALRGIPLVFTHHTMYEQYAHYVGDLQVFKEFIVRLATEFANACDHVIAPSESVAEVLRERGVTTSITAVPTGINPEEFGDGNGVAARDRYGIPQDAFVVGHVGRLAPEKNLAFLARAVAAFMKTTPNAHFLVVGGGPSEEEIVGVFSEAGLAERLQRTGPLKGQELADAYDAMDVFAFSSQSETQGMVLAEAMMQALPVVALDAPGARDVVTDGHNGRLLEEADEAAFATALRSVAAAPRRQYRRLGQGALATAQNLTLERCADDLLGVYERLLHHARDREQSAGIWDAAVGLVEAEWRVWSNRVGAAVQALGAGS